MLCAGQAFAFKGAFYFLEQVCDVMAVYEAALMENFTSRNVGFHVCT